MKCKCGRDLTTGDLNGMCLTCYNNQNTKINEPPPVGWICPKCGFVWAVWVDGCSNCNVPQYEIKSTDGTNHADKTRP